MPSLLVFPLPFCCGFSGLPWIPWRFMISLRYFSWSSLCKFVFVAFSDCQFYHFWIIILWYVLCRNLRDEKMARACRPWSITRKINDWRQTDV
jgi:hypothetical protein